MRGDAMLSDGSLHARSAWSWLHQRLKSLFTGWTRAPGAFEGVWLHAGTGRYVADKSKKYTVAVAAKAVEELRNLLAEVCVKFRQQCIYLSVAGKVEFVEPKS